MVTKKKNLFSSLAVGVARDFLGTWKSYYFTLNEFYRGFKGLKYYYVPCTVYISRTLLFKKKNLKSRLFIEK